MKYIIDLIMDNKIASTITAIALLGINYRNGYLGSLVDNLCKTIIGNSGKGHTDNEHATYRRKATSEAITSAAALGVVGYCTFKIVNKIIGFTR